MQPLHHDPVPPPIPAGPTPPPPVSAAAISVHVSVDRPSNNLALASLSLGVLGLLICWVPIAGIAAGAIGILLSLVGSLVALRQSGRGIGYSLAGLVLSVVAAASGVVLGGLTLETAEETSRVRRAMESRAEKRPLAQKPSDSKKPIGAVLAPKVPPKTVAAATPINEAKKDSPPLAIAPFDERKARRHQEAWAGYLGVPVKITNSIGMTFVLIPPGEFAMGSTVEQVAGEIPEARMEGWPADRIAAELPQHRVRVTRPLYFGALEVTQGQYERIMGHNPSSRIGETYPVDDVAWPQAVDFCRRLSDRPGEGHTYRLPTEAEWEYACRAGTEGRWSWGDEASGGSAHGWTRDNSSGQMHEAGSLASNAWGLFDMHGNVWEWCSDWWSAEYYRSSPSTDPPGPVSGPSGWVLRGGSWVVSCHLSRSANRHRWNIPTPNSGFRCVCKP